MQPRRFLASLIIIGLFIQTNFLQAITLSLQDYALPDNAIREKLASLFNPQSSITTACVRDKTWVDFGSWHWLIGQLAADDDTKFVVKGAKYPPHASITTPQYPGIMQIHDAQQNISRIARSLQAQKIITDKQLITMRIPPTWAYPLSGNNRDLYNSNITDQQVMIVEGLVRKKSDDKVWCSYVSDKVQSDVLHINQDTFRQLVTFAQQGKFLDLTPKNLLVDTEGKLVVIDLEDTLAYQRKELDTTHFLLRPLKRFKLKCKEEGAAMYGVGITGLSNTDNIHIRRHGQQLINKARCTLLIKRNIVEIVAIALAFFGVAFLLMRHMYSLRTIHLYIKKCKIRMHQLLRTQQKELSLSPIIYQAIAQQAVKSIKPDEYRDTIFNAFATIAIAESIHHKNMVTILGREYSCPQRAISQSIKRIIAIWKHDHLSKQRGNDINVVADKKVMGIALAW